MNTSTDTKTVKFTPGKWEISPKDYATVKRPAASLCIAVGGKLVVRITETPHYNATEEDVANAKLIAASPTLLEKAIAMIEAQEMDAACLRIATEELKAAIQLATE